jgi:hypothetical protein
VTFNPLNKHSCNSESKQRLAVDMRSNDTKHSIWTSEETMLQFVYYSFPTLYNTVQSMF